MLVGIVGAGRCRLGEPSKTLARPTLGDERDEVLNTRLGTEVLELAANRSPNQVVVDDAAKPSEQPLFEKVVWMTGRIRHAGTLSVRDRSEPGAAAALDATCSTAGQARVRRCRCSTC